MVGINHHLVKMYFNKILWLLIAINIIQHVRGGILSSIFFMNKVVYGPGLESNWKENCDGVANAKLKWACFGTYTKEFKKKYMDLHIELGSNFTLFTLVEDDTLHFISFGYPYGKDQCKEIIAKSPKLLTCDDKSTIFTTASMYCLSNTYKISSTAMKICGINLSDSGITVIHYINNEKLLNASTTISTSWIPFFLKMTMLLVTMPLHRKFPFGSFTTSHLTVGAL